MNASCAEIRIRFEDYAAERLVASDRLAVREHLAGCLTCREEAAASDPTLLFAAPAPEEVSAQEVARILSAVRTAIDFRSAERRLAGQSKGRRFRVAASAAAVVALLLAMPGAPARHDEILISRAASARLERVHEPVERRMLPVAEPAGYQKPKRPSDATIYDLNPGGGEPRVIWIMDRSLDI